MLRRMILLLTLGLLWLAIASPAMAANGVTVLCYHDIGKVDNDYTITRDTLRAHFDYLRQNGYTPISLKQYIEANENKGALPAKPVLLTFDDGYVSFYNEVYPLLKQYQYPAVLAVVTYWQTAQKPADVGPLVSWQQMKEMEQSGLVAIASHSHNLHHGVAANAFGDRGEPASALLYREGRYESLDAYKARIAKDLEENQQIFARELGHRVEAIAWPYGEYTLHATEIARNLGFKVAMGLGGRYNQIGGDDSLREARRGLIYKSADLAGFGRLLQRGGNDDLPLRAAWVNIDLLYQPGDQRLTDINVRSLTDRYLRLGINTVFLQAYSTLRGAGEQEAVYFHTDRAPVKAPVFDHIARKFRAEGIYVYAAMPTPDGDAGKRWQALYADLSTYSFLDGIIWQDSGPRGDTPDLTADLMAVVRQFKPYAKFARTVDAEAVLGGSVHPSVGQALTQYDFAIVVNPGYRDRTGPRPVQWTAEVAAAAMKQPGAADRLVMQISAYDGDKKRWLLDSELRDHVRAARDRGVRQFAFFPDALFNEKSGLLIP